MKIDVRTPSDTQDFEITMSRAPTPVLEFTVKASGNDLAVEILEQRTTAGRGGNVGYRILYAPASLVTNSQLDGSRLGAVADLCDTVTYLPASNDGGRQRIIVPSRSADRGWYLCAPVGQRGMVGTPTGLVRTPWSS